MCCKIEQYHTDSNNQKTMLRIQSALNAEKTADNQHRAPRVGLAAAGGGPLGAIYELGALRALDESVDGLALHQLDTYVGVSVGALLSASLANQVTTAQMCRIFMSRTDAEHSFKPEAFLKPAYREYLRQIQRMPGVTVNAVFEILRNPVQKGLSETVNAISRLLPTGLFNNKTINDFVEEVLSVPGRTNDFRELASKLFVVAVDLDTGAAVRFGEADTAHVPISRAVQASTALPGLYPPVTIDGRDYVDGALRRTLHASVALNQELDLLIAINPLVPYDADEQPEDIPKRRLSRTDLYLVMSQTFRSMIQSRMQIGIEQYYERFPDTSILLAEPNRHDGELFFTNIFSFSGRQRLCEHAYQTMRTELSERRDELNAFFSQYNMQLNDAVLSDSTRTLADSLTNDKQHSAPVTKSLQKSLEKLRDNLSNHNA